MSLINVYITGHGKWDPDFSGWGDASLPGFTTVPSKSKVIFYIHNSKTMMPRDVWNILEGTYTGSPESEYNANQSVPNMKLSAVSLSEKAQDYSHFEVGKDTLPEGSVFYSPSSTKSLSQTMKRVRDHFGLDNEYVFHWLCCRALALKGKVSGEGGINARELLDRQEYHFLDRSNGGKRLIKKVKI